MASIGEHFSCKMRPVLCSCGGGCGVHSKEPEMPCWNGIFICDRREERDARGAGWLILQRALLKLQDLEFIERDLNKEKEILELVFFFTIFVLEITYLCDEYLIF